jgi:Ca2+:H+ antiporter
VMMIVLGGGVGVCLTLGAMRYRVQDHRPQGTSSFLALLMALSVLTLILPDFTSTAAAGTFSATQLGFVSTLSVLLYAAFLYMQANRHHDDFFDSASPPHERPGSAPKTVWLNVVALIGGLAAVVLLAERVAAGVEDGLAAIGVAHPDPIIGALIAAMLLFPEMLTAARASLHNELQRSINVMLGSALATVALTVPAVAFVSLFTGKELTLGLNGRDQVMLLLTLALSIVSFGTGRTNVMTGLVHLVIFFAYVLLLFVP